MIFSYSEGVVSIIDYDVRTSEAVNGHNVTIHLETAMSFELFKSKFPDFPPMGNGLTNIAYEPDSNMYHLVSKDGFVVCSHPNENVITKWIKSNEQNLLAFGIKRRRAELRGDVNELLNMG